MRSLTISCSKNSLLTVRRSSRWHKKLVYILLANRSYKYPSDKRSRIIYIGTTGKGAGRPAASAVHKATEAFAQLHGVKEIEVHIATCRGRKSTRTWEHLESALLATFRDIHWALPKYNKKKGAKHKKLLFRDKALRKFILQFEGS